MLSGFIQHTMRMSHIYQPVMLMELLNRGGSASRREIVALLEPRGVLTPCDAPMVELTARTLATMRQADAVIGREGSTMRTASGYLQQRPEVALSHKSRLLLKQLLGELGMSPASRSNVDGPAAGGRGVRFPEVLGARPAHP